MEMEEEVEVMEELESEVDRKGQVSNFRRIEDNRIDKMDLAY
jgi:hypothetical protein